MLTLLLTIILVLTPCQSDVIVTTQLGKIRGHQKTSFNHQTFSAFEGIPYAKPPIGQRRFEKAEPIEKWDGIWDATFLYECVQLQTKITGDEDCLYLNVYVPRTHINTSEKLDVIVHIHGGGFMFGSGHSYAFPGYLMDHEVIFVTFNYRLGVLGFLSTEDDVVPGNNGLKDQALALKWVQSHIERFGGNPDSVTLTGASAGAASVHLHYFSPISLGLFHRGLSQSGTALNPWTIQRKALQKAEFLARAVGCPDHPTRNLTNCLKQRTYQQILNQIHLLYGYKNLPTCLFGPVVEKGTEPFLGDEPYRLLVRKQVLDLPWVASFVPHEAGSMFPGFRNSSDELNAIWNEFAAIILYYHELVPRAKWEDVTKKIQNFYFGQRFTYDGFVKIATDRMVVDGVVKSVNLQARTTNASVYCYELSYTGDKKNFVEHADDNQYFFYDNTGTRPTQNELKMKNVMVNMLVTYASKGTPTIEGVVWKPVKFDQLNVLNISGFETENFELQTNLNLANGDFWNSLNLDCLECLDNFN